MKKDRVMRWDIITLAEDVQARQVPGVEFFKKHFAGNCYELFYDRNGNQKPAKVRNWSTTITTTAVDKEGNTHTMELEFTPDHKTKLTELTTGINAHWIAECDATLPDMDCISAIAVARCRA